MHTGTAGGGGLTRVGKHALVMSGVHVAHDCHLHDKVRLIAFVHTRITMA